MLFFYTFLFSPLSFDQKASGAVENSKDSGHFICKRNEMYMMLADANVLAPHADQDSLITIEDNVKQHFVTIENIYIYKKDTIARIIARVQITC